MRDRNSRKNSPWHVLAVVILGNIIRGKDACKKLEKRGIDLENGKEDDEGDHDMERVSERWVAGRDADKETAKWVRDKQAKDQLESACQWWSAQTASRVYLDLVEAGAGDVGQRHEDDVHGQRGNLSFIKKNPGLKPASISFRKPILHLCCSRGATQLLDICSLSPLNVIGM